MKMFLVALTGFCNFFKPKFEAVSVLKILTLCYIIHRLFITDLLASTEHPAIKASPKNSNFEEPYFEGVDYRAPWEYMGTDVTQICSAALEYYEWGVRYNNDGPILRVTCNTWNSGYRVCTNPEYPQDDTNPFTWGGACWIWGTHSLLDNGCPQGYHMYYQQDANGKLNMIGGNGCGSLPSVYRRRY